MNRLHISLTDQAKRRLELLKADGGYASESETLREALKFLEVLVRARQEDATIIVRDYSGVERELVLVIPGGPPCGDRA